MTDSDREARRAAVVLAALAWYRARQWSGRLQGRTTAELNARDALEEAVAALLELEAGDR